MAKWKQDSSGNWKKSTSKSDKNYTIVDGKKVLKSSIAKSSDSSSLSSSWDKSTVTLEEAKNQSTQAASYLLAKEEEVRADSGILPSVDTVDTGLADSWNKQTVSLEEAKQQSGQAVEYLVAKDTQTAEAQAIAEAQAQEEVSKSEQMRNGLVGTNTSMYSDVTGQYVPSVVNQEYAATYLANQQAAKVQAQKRAIEQSQTAQLISSFGRVDLQEDAEVSRSERLASFITGISNRAQSSSVGMQVSSAANEIAGSGIVKKAVAVEDTLLAAIGMPTITQATDEASKVVSSISEAASYGFSGGQKGKIETSDKEYLTAGIARKGAEYAEKVSEKGSALVSKGVDLLAGKDDVLQVPSFVGTGQTINIPAQVAKDFTTGATVDMASFLVSGASGVPLAVEVTARDPTKAASALISGAGLVAGGAAKMIIDEPARFVGSIAGGAALGKVAGTGAKATEAIKQNRPLNPGTTKKANVMGFEAEIPKTVTNPDIGKAFKDFVKYASEPDFRIVETPETATVLKGYTITKDATGTKVKPKIEIVETSNIPKSEIELFNNLNKENERILSSKYEKSSVKGGITTAQSGAMDVKLYKPTQVKAKNVIQDISAETLDFKVSDQWRMEIEMPKTKGTGRSVDSIEQFESRKVVEQHSPEFAEDVISNISYEKTLHPKISIDRMGESYDFVRGQILPEKVPKTPKATKSQSPGKGYGRALEISERFEGGEKASGKLKVSGKLPDPNAKAWEIPELDNFKSMNLGITEGIMRKEGTLSARGKALKPGSKKPSLDIVPDDAFSQGNYKTHKMSGFSELGTQMDDSIRSLGDLKYTAPDKMGQFSGNLPKSAKNAVSGKGLKKTKSTQGEGKTGKGTGIKAEIKPANKLKPGEIDAKQILEINKGTKKTVQLLNKKAARSVQQVKKVTRAGLAVGTIANTGIKSAALPSQAQGMPQFQSPFQENLPATLITPVLGILPGQTNLQNSRQKQVQWISPIQQQRQQQVPALDLIQDAIPDTIKKPEEIIVPGGGFDFYKPGRKVPVLLPGKKRETKKKTKQSKAKVKPGTLHNKYRNPLDIKFKL
jgi:hypothetical protein